MCVKFQYWIPLNTEIRRGNMCLDYDLHGNGTVMIWPCHGEFHLVTQLNQTSHAIDYR